ncbi:MAG: class I SAM-dependent methyltransferase, partial [Methanophagales archaeon]|nr:class I SAM-dependent methyltransferase [Methanophagales archaeon]
MELNELLGIGNFTLVEESYANQKGIGRTLEYLGKIEGEDVVEAIRIFAESRGKGKDKELIGIGIKDKDLGFWIIFTDVIVDRRSKEEFEALASEIKGAKVREVEVKREKFREGVIEFYSTGLVNRLFCECDLKEESFYPRERTESLKKVLSEFLRENDIDIGGNKKTLEIGCGDGGATIAVHESGIFPITVDINKCEICKGLEEGVLEPKKSIVLDCSVLSSFFGKEFDVVFGFMVGKITPFERFSWEKVLREVPKVLKSKGKVLFTVSSEEEARIVNEILKDEFEGEIKENKGSDGYLDHWLYV